MERGAWWTRYAQHGQAPPLCVRVANPLEGAVAAAMLERAGHARLPTPGAPADAIRALVYAAMMDAVSGPLDRLFGRVPRVRPVLWQRTWLAIARQTWRVLPLLPERGVTVDAMMRMAEPCGSEGAWWWAFSEVCVVTERPRRFARDAAGRLHHASEMALEYEGFGVWAWHGVRVPRQVIQAPGELEAREVLHERNAAVRRVMIERVGVERMLSWGAERVDAGDGRELWRIPIAEDEPVVAVRVVCPSTGRAYFLRVPPGTRTCAEGVAWTFGMDERDYRPAIET